MKCLLIYKLCNLLNIQFGENWKIGKQLFKGGSGEGVCFLSHELVFTFREFFIENTSSLHKAQAACISYVSGFSE